tara:strand:- start:100 stop:390 length:291 start_codon:yes stop_codon:yes gene_type:complete
MVHLHKSAKLTKYELENIKKMTPFIEWKKLMKKAKNYKSSYLGLKSKNTKTLSEANKKALIELMKSERESAIDYYNKAEKVKNDYPHIIKMINSLK